jgi:hypothetical protein
MLGINGPADAFSAMPLYRFALLGQDLPLEEPPEWLADDVEALKVVADIASDMAKNRDDPLPFIVAVRVAGRIKS